MPTLYHNDAALCTGHFAELAAFGGTVAPDFLSCDGRKFPELRFTSWLLNMLRETTEQTMMALPRNRTDISEEFRRGQQ